MIGNGGALKGAISIAVELIKDVAFPKRRTTTMTAFAGTRVASRPTSARVARPTTLTAVRESLQGFRGALRSATDSRGADYADALFIGRS